MHRCLYRLLLHAILPFTKTSPLLSRNMWTSSVHRESTSSSRNSFRNEKKSGMDPILKFRNVRYLMEASTHEIIEKYYALVTIILHVFSTWVMTLPRGSETLNTVIHSSDTRFSDFCRVFLFECRVWKQL